MHALVEVLYLVTFPLIGRHLTVSEIEKHVILDDDVHL